MQFIAWSILIVWGGIGVVMFLWGISLTFMDGRAADGVRTIGNSLIVLVGALVVFAMLTPDGDDPAAWRTGGSAGSYSGAGSGAGVSWGGGTTCDEDEWGDDGYVEGERPNWDKLENNEIGYLISISQVVEELEEIWREFLDRVDEPDPTYDSPLARWTGSLEVNLSSVRWTMWRPLNTPSARQKKADRLLKKALKRTERAVRAWNRGATRREVRERVREARRLSREAIESLSPMARHLLHVGSNAYFDGE